MNLAKIQAKISAMAEDDYFSLTDEERTFYNIKNILDAVNGKGLLSYYESDCSNYAIDAVDDLYSAGMDEVASVIESANAIFPGGCPPEEAEDRVEIIDSWEHEYDSLYDQWTDDIMEFSVSLEEACEKLARAFSK